MQAKVGDAVDAAKATAEGMKRRLALQREGGAGAYEVLQEDADDEPAQLALPAPGNGATNHAAS